MKFTTLLFGLTVLSFLSVGCEPTGDRTSDPATETTRDQTTRTDGNRTDGAVGAGARDTREYAYEERTQFGVSMEAELEEINRSIDQLATRIDRADAETKAAASTRLNELRNQADLLQEQIDGAKNASASTWDNVKATTRETHTNLKNNFEDARQWISNKLEP